MTRQGSQKIVDPFLLKILEQHRGQTEFTDILRSIQLEQNDIVDYDLDKNIVVQGCAGSGKTMILFHRLANILYNLGEFSKKITPGQIAIIIPNNNFKEYIKTLTSSLGIENIRTFTMDEYLISKIENVVRKIFKDEGSDSIHGCGKSKKDSSIARLIEDIKKQLFDGNTSSSETVTFEPEAAQKLAGFITSYQNSRELMIARRNAERERRSVNKKIDKNYNKWLEDSLQDIRKYRNETISTFKKDFLNDKLSRGYMIGLLCTICSNDELLEYCPSADAMLMIDEGQDYGLDEYTALKAINQNCIFNIYGDIDQKIYERGTGDWNKILVLLDAKYFFLNQDYRNSNQIVDFVNGLLNKHIQAVGFSTKDVESVSIEKLPIYLEYESKLLRHSSAIITEKPDIYKNIPDNIRIMATKQIKGLEFDAVFISPEIMAMSKNYQYVALTRALRHLYILE